VAIRRNGARPASNFTIVSNDFARDGRLSFKARGVGLYILTHAEAFVLSVASIARANACGESLVKAALKELEDAGYLLRERQRDGAGRLAEMDYLMSDAPQAPEGAPPAEKPAVDFPPVDKPLVEKRGTKKNTSKKINPKKINPSGGATAEAASAPGLFEVEPEPTDEPLVNDAVHPGAVVAAYVDSYRTAHQGETPLGMDLRKVGATAKRMLADPNVNPSLLTVAATEMGRTAFTDLAGQYRRVTARPTSGTFSPSGDLRRGVTMVASTPDYQPDDVWAQLAAQQDQVNARMDAALNQFTPNADLEV
jgi:hypothetical protein